MLLFFNKYLKKNGRFTTAYEPLEGSPAMENLPRLEFTTLWWKTLRNDGYLPNKPLKGFIKSFVSLTTGKADSYIATTRISKSPPNSLFWM